MIIIFKKNLLFTCFLVLEEGAVPTCVLVVRVMETENTKIEHPNTLRFFNTLTENQNTSFSLQHFENLIENIRSMRNPVAHPEIEFQEKSDVIKNITEYYKNNKSKHLCLQLYDTMWLKQQ